jgi:DNA-binding transcriptional MerR regulator
VSEPIKKATAARILGVSTSMIRWYIKKGVIGAVRDTNGHRLLSPEDVARIKKARAAAAKPIGCAFCGEKIPQHRTFCEKEECRKRRWRIRWKRSQARKGGAMTRDEHLRWAKDRALEYVDAGDTRAAFWSLTSDLTKHDELGEASRRQQGGAELLVAGELDTPAKMREWIESFR